MKFGKASLGKANTSSHLDKLGFCQVVCASLVGHSKHQSVTSFMRFCLWVNANDGKKKLKPFHAFIFASIEASCTVEIFEGGTVTVKTKLGEISTERFF